MMEVASPAQILGGRPRFFIRLGEESLCSGEAAIGTPPSNCKEVHGADGPFSFVC